MTARFSMLLKSQASLTCFRARFLPGRAKDLSGPRYKFVKVFPLEARCGPELYSSMTTALEGVSGQQHTPAAPV